MKAKPGKQNLIQNNIALQHTLQKFWLLMIQLDVSGLKMTDGIIALSI